jgi:hypothetical protein
LVVAVKLPPFVAIGEPARTTNVGRLATTR